MNPVVILTLNNLHLSKEAVKSVLAQTVPIELLIIDQGSTDGTIAWARQLAAMDRRVRFIAPRATSVAQAWNIGCRYFFERGAHEVLLLNNDLEILPETYQTLSDWAAADDEQKIGMVTCVSRRERSELVYEKPFSHSPRPDFSCALMQKWAWKAIGGFDENCIGAFFEDNCAHAECHSRGILAESISLPFLHHGSQTVKNADYADKKRITACYDKNKKYFFEKYGRWPGTEGYDDLFSAERFGAFAQRL